MNSWAAILNLFNFEDVMQRVFNHQLKQVFVSIIKWNTFLCTTSTHQLMAILVFGDNEQWFSFYFITSAHIQFMITPKRLICNHVSCLSSYIIWFRIFSCNVASVILSLQWLCNIAIYVVCMAPTSETADITRFVPQKDADTIFKNGKVCCRLF